MSLVRMVTAVAELLGHESHLVTALRPAYERLLDLVSADRGLPWYINGVRCRIDPRVRARLPASYEPGAAAFLAAHLRAGDICFNVGAHVGAYVIQLAHWTGPTGRVVAFEPNPDTHAILLRHVRFNGLTDRVEIVSSAIAEETGARTLFAVGTDGRSRLGAPSAEIEARARSMEVPVTTIDGFCVARGIRPNWIVMDIEGFEIAALQGARQTLSTAPRPQIVVEMHPFAWPLSGTSRADAEALLRALGLVPLSLSGQADPLGSHGVVYLAASDEIP